MRRAASLKFYLKNPKKNGKLRDVEVSIIYKFTARPGGRFEDPTGLWINPRFWDFKRQEVKAIHPDNLQLNQKLLDLKKSKLALFEKHGHNFEEFETVARGLSPVNEVEKKSLSSATKLFLEQYATEKDPRTVTSYRNMFKYFEPFSVLPFEKLDWNFFDAFKKVLQEAGLQDASVRKYFQNLKCFLRWATHRGYQVNQVFQGWRTPKRKKTKLKLSLAELELLEKAMLPAGPGMGRDFLCLEARTGARIGDLLRFDKRDFDFARKTWTYNRQKNKSRKAKTVTVPFVGFIAPALRILEKYDFELPKYTQQMINRLIREACDIVNINGVIKWETWQAERPTVTEVEKWTKISTHVGRKTFITLGLQFMEPKIVKDLAGIDSWDTLREYELESEPQFVEHALTQMQEKIKAAKDQQADQKREAV